MNYHVNDRNIQKHLQKQMCAHRLALSPISLQKLGVLESLLGILATLLIYLHIFRDIVSVLIHSLL